MKPDHTEIAAVLDLLAERFPRCFSIYERRRKPLKVGIRADIINTLDGVITPEELHRALRFYTSNIGYLRAMLCGAWRVDLAGNPVGTISTDEEANARRRLAAIQVKRDQRKEEIAKAKAAAEAKAAPKRLSLADLKAAALARKSQCLA